MCELIADMAEVSGEEVSEEEADYYDYGEGEYEFVVNRKSMESPPSEEQKKLDEDIERANREKEKLLKEQATKRPLSQDDNAVNIIVKSLKEPKKKFWTEKRKAEWQANLKTTQRNHGPYKRRKPKAVLKKFVPYSPKGRNPFPTMMNQKQDKPKTQDKTQDKQTLPYGYPSQYTCQYMGEESVYNNDDPYAASVSGFVQGPSQQKKGIN